jgi:hypothetical protein
VLRPVIFHLEFPKVIVSLVMELQDTVIMSQTSNEAELLLQKCVGNEVQIPYLFTLFPTWHPELSPYDKEIEKEVEDWRQRYCSHRHDSNLNLNLNSLLDGSKTLQESCKINYPILPCLPADVLRNHDFLSYAFSPSW